MELVICVVGLPILKMFEKRFMRNLLKIISSYKPLV
jgi:hypothetical protein